MKRTVERKIIEGLEAFADALERGEDLSRRFTCRKVAIDLHPTPYSPRLVKKTRAILGVSQTLFAQFLGVSTNTVQAWEQGTTLPQPMACRFMDEIQHDPQRWRKRFQESIVPRTA